MESGDQPSHPLPNTILWQSYPQVIHSSIDGRSRITYVFRNKRNSSVDHDKKREGSIWSNKEDRNDPEDSKDYEEAKTDLSPKEGKFFSIPIHPSKKERHFSRSKMGSTEDISGNFGNWSSSKNINGFQSVMSPSSFTNSFSSSSAHISSHRSLNKSRGNRSNDYD